MPTTLSRGQVAIIGVNTEDTGNPQRDFISFVLLAPITTGTVIFFTDRSWNGTVFSASGGLDAGDGTFTYTASGNLAAGTVITISQAQLTAAGMALDSDGDTIYVYQGTNANTPTVFLHAVELADGNNTFNGSLVNTGLVAGTSALAIGDDNIEYGGRTHNVNVADLFVRYNDFHRWVHNDNSPQDGTVGLNAVTNAGTPDPAFTAPDAQLWVAASGGGEAIVTINLDGTYASGSLGYQLVQAFQNDANLFHPSDITLDTVHGKFFFVDSDAVGHNRIVEGNISQLLNNPGDAATFTILYTNAGSGATGVIASLSVDTINGIIYFDVGSSSTGSSFDKITYSLNGASTANQVPTVLATLGNGHFVTQMAIDYVHGTVLLGTSRIIAVFGTDVVEQNYVYRATGLTAGSASLTFTELPFNPDDNDAGGPNNANIPGLPGEAWPVERGTIQGIDIDEVTQIAYIITGAVSLDVSAAQDGSQMQSFPGGIYSYALVGNPNGDVVTLFTQNFATGPVGLMDYIEVDHATGRYYLTDMVGTSADPGDQSVWTGSLTVAQTPTLVAIVGNLNGLGPQGLEIQHAPVLTGASLAATFTETGGNPSPNGTPVTTANGFNSTDIDSGGASNGDELAGAQVRISGNFQSGAGHADQLLVSTFNTGTNQNGTIVIGGDTVSYSYNATTGTMTFTGVTTLDNYENIIARVQFRTDGDNPTAFGSAGTRTISYATFDGLLYSDEVHATVTVVGINDAPVNTPGAAMNFNEDVTGSFGAEGIPPTLVRNAVTGISVFDVDADPATQDITVTLSVGVGTLTIRTDVVNGIQPSDVISGNGTGTIVITATQNQINTTLAALSPAFTGPPAAAASANGLIYTSPANYNGATNLTITTNDGGFNGNDPGLTGTGTSEQDQDTKTINIADVNDAPTVGGDGTESAATILEDTPFNQATPPVAPTVSTLFAGQFADAVDIQVTGGNPTGSVGDTFAGIAIVADGSAPATGQWEYWNGAAWTDIGAASQAAARTFSAATQIRFNPALNYNGPAPTLTVHLIETGGPAITENGTVNLSPAGTATGGTTVYSTGTVVLSQTITAVNDAPVNTVGGTLTIAEDSAATNVTGMSIADVDANPATDVFTVTLDVLNGTLNLSTAVAGGVTAGNVTGNGTATITVTGTINQVNATLAAAGGLTYTPTANYNGADRVQITTNDGGASGQDPGLTGTGTTEQDQDSKTISVTAVNDPVTGAAPASATLDEDSANVAISGLSISDVDAALAPAGVYNVTVSSTNGTMTLTTLTGLTFTSGDGTSDATMTFHGTLADINVALATANYTPTANYNGAATITLNVTDTFGGIVATGTGLATNDSDVINVTVTAVNDPVATNAPPTATMNEDATNVAIAGLSIADADAALAPAGVYDVTLAATHGTLTLTTLTGLTFGTGDGTGDTTMTFHGTLADINAALATAKYTPDANYNGAAQISIDATDTFGGIVATGTGSATADLDTIAVTVNSVNDEPAGTDDSAGATEGTTYVFQTTDFSDGFSDPIDGNAFAGVKITTLPGTGTIKLSGVAISAGAVITKAQLDGGNLTFDPAAGSGGTSPTFTFQVQDDGGVANSGVDLDQSANTFTLNIAPANMAPTLDLDGNDSVSVGTGFSSAYTEGGAAAAIGDVDVTITDPDAGDDVRSATITITNAVTGDMLNVGALPAGITLDGSSTDTVVKLIGVLGTTAADFEAAIEAVTFSSSSDNPTALGTNMSRSITVVINDGDADSNVATATVQVTDVNDAPSGSNATITATEDSFRLLSAADLGFSDVDGTFGSVTVSAVTGGKIYVDADGTAGAGVPVEATLPVVFTAQDLIDGKASFMADPNLNGSGVATITFTVTDEDGADSASSNTLTVDVTAANDTPDIDGVGSPVNATEQTAAAILAGKGVSDVDLDARNGGNGDYAGASFSIARNLAANPEDAFSLVAGPSFTIVGNDLKAGGLIFGTITTNAGGQLVIAFTSLETPATSALVDEVISAVNYTNTSDNPPSSVSLAYTFDDGAPGGGQGAGAIATDDQIVSVLIAGVNDAPVNSLGGTIGTGEDAVDAWLSGMSISDPDADSATDDFVVTFGVGHGTLDIRTDVVGGVTAGDVTGDDTGTVTVTATLDEINATLAAANGLTYSPDLNFNGGDALTVTTDDGGASGSGGALQDLDTRTISVSAVNDAPVVAGDGTEDAPDVVENTPSPTGDTVFSLFGGQYSDAADAQFSLANPGGSSPGSFGGIAVVANGSTGATGQWQYFNSNTSTWVDVGAVAANNALLIGSGTAIRFNPAAGFLGAAPTLTVHLIDNSLGFGITFGQHADISGAGATGGTTAYSTGQVVLSEDVVPANLAPVVDLNTGTGGIDDTNIYQEGGSASGIGAAISVSDPDAGDNIESATVAISDPETGDILTVNLPLPGGITVDTANSTDVFLVLIGTASPADYATALGQVGFSSTSDDPTAGGTHTTRDIGVTVEDGTASSAPAMMTMTVLAVDDAPDTRPDSFTTDEATAIAGDVLADNGSGADSDVDTALAVTAVNGSGAAVGNQITLASGALLTLNADGTFSYDPNGAFDFTPSAASGASNTPSHDSFTYTLTGGLATTVSVAITGIDTADFLLGTAGDDILIGGADGDILAGLGGDDMLIGGSGAANELIGGQGDDSYFVVNSGDTVVEQSGGGTDRVLTALASYSLAGLAEVDNLVGLSSAGQTLTGNALDNVIIGQDGDDVLSGGLGRDVLIARDGNDILAGGSGAANELYGGAGDDTYVLSANDTVVELAGEGTDKVLTSQQSHTLGANLENLIFTGAGDFTGTGNSAANVIVGGAGNDRLSDGGGSAADTLIGGSGNDTYVVSVAGDSIVELGGGGTDTVETSASFYQLGANLENLTYTGAGNFVGVGNSADNAITGGAGDDLLAGGLGADTLTGNGGADQFLFNTALGGGNVDSIVGFASGSDRIFLDHNVFTGLATGGLASGEFVVGSAATHEDHRIIYDNTTGNLYYDADGNGAGAAVLFATVQGHPILLASDFGVI
jgi:hypothetical protein